MRRVARFGVVVACVALALGAVGCGKSTPTATPATTPNSPAPSVELGSVKYTLVSRPTQVGDIAEGHAGFVDLSAVVVNPDAGEDKPRWYGYRAATAAPAEAQTPHTLVSQVILVAHEKGGKYVFDVVVACVMAESTEVSPLTNWGDLTVDDPKIIEFTPVGTDLCGRASGAGESPQPQQ